MKFHIKRLIFFSFLFSAHATNKIYIGGESHALEHLQKRLNVEFNAFVSNSFLPNRRNPELLRPPKSLSPDLRFGSLSIR